MGINNKEFNILVEWTKRYFTPKESINYNMSAYQIHGIFERLYPKGFYVTEFDIIDAMKVCGYRTKEADGQTYFNISQKSQALRVYYRSLGTSGKADPSEWL